MHNPSKKRSNLKATHPTLMIPSAPTPQNKPLLPKVGALPAGRYRSTILSVDYTLTDTNEIAYVDIIHKLVDSTGGEYTVNFRYYTPHDTDRLLEIFSGYGFRGELQTVVGLIEDVEVTLKPSSQYLRISKRSMYTSPTSVLPSPTTHSLLEDDDDMLDLDEEDFS